jgi:uncharacterized membrane protein SpoIIM required for sporulation
VKQQAFEEAHGGGWQAFETLLDALELGRGNHAMAARELDRWGSGIDPQTLPERYRRLCHDLALARERRFSVGLVDRLNRLVLRGHQVLYGVRPSGGRRLVELLAIVFPARVRALWRPILLAAALFWVPLLGLALTVPRFPELAFLVEDPQSLADAERMYADGEKKFGRKDQNETDVVMFGFYVWNNVRIDFQAFASGLFLGLGSAFFLFWNGLHGGAVVGHLVATGHGRNLFSFVVTHSALEVTALVFAGAAGLVLGWAIISPGRRSRPHSLLAAAAEALPLVSGAAVMTLLAAVIEAFWSSSAVLPQALKFAVGGLLWVAVAAYFGLAGRRRA